jgi:hypothetical protein
MMALANIKSLALAAWAFLNAGLLLGIGGELGWGENLPYPMPSPVVHPSAPVEIELYPDFRLPAPEKAYAGTLERPLFVPGRRKAPPPPPPPPPPRPTMQKGQFQLLGTIITDETKIAVVREIASGKERQVVQGYTINGLQLELVEANRIVFTQYEDREEIRLKIQPSPKPVSKAVSAPPGGQPAKPQAAQVIPEQAVRPSTRWEGKGTSTGPAARPTPIASPPQTMEERKQNPMLKDFYK